MPGHRAYRNCQYLSVRTSCLRWPQTAQSCFAELLVEQDDNCGVRVLRVQANGDADKVGVLMSSGPLPEPQVPGAMAFTLWERD